MTKHECFDKRLRVKHQLNSKAKNWNGRTWNVKDCSPSVMDVQVWWLWQNVFNLAKITFSKTVLKKKKTELIKLVARTAQSLLNWERARALRASEQLLNWMDQAVTLQISGTKQCVGSVMDQSLTALSYPEPSGTSYNQSPWPPRVNDPNAEPLS